MTTVAVILLSVSLQFITLYHLPSISSLLCVLSCITLSHLITHIRCAASDIKICRRQVAPLYWSFDHSACSFPCASCSSTPFVCADRQPHPMIVPKLSSGHGAQLCGHVPFARFHTSSTGRAVHLKSMWSMFSVSLHVVQALLCSKPGILVHITPIIWVLWIVLKRNCCTRSLKVRFLMLFYSVSSFS